MFSPTRDGFVVSHVNSFGPEFGKIPSGTGINFHWKQDFCCSFVKTQFNGVRYSIITWCVGTNRWVCRLQLSVRSVLPIHIRVMPASHTKSVLQEVASYFRKRPYARCDPPALAEKISQDRTPAVGQISCSSRSRGLQPPTRGGN